MAPRVVTTPLGRPAPQEPTLGGVLPEGRDCGTPQPVKGRGLPQKEAGPNSSASKGHPGKEDTAWELLLPESKGEGSEPGKEGPARAPASRVSARGRASRAGLPCSLCLPVWEGCPLGRASWAGGCARAAPNPELLTCLGW